MYLHSGEDYSTESSHLTELLEALADLDSLMNPTTTTTTTEAPTTTMPGDCSPDGCAVCVGRGDYESEISWELICFNTDYDFYLSETGEAGEGWGSWDITV